MMCSSASGNGGERGDDAASGRSSGWWSFSRPSTDRRPIRGSPRTLGSPRMASARSAARGRQHFPRVRGRARAGRFRCRGATRGSRRPFGRPPATSRKRWRSQTSLGPATSPNLRLLPWSAGRRRKGQKRPRWRRVGAARQSHPRNHQWPSPRHHQLPPLPGWCRRRPRPLGGGCLRACCHGSADAERLEVVVVVVQL